MSVSLDALMTNGGANGANSGLAFAYDTTGGTSISTTGMTVGASATLLTAALVLNGTATAVTITWNGVSMTLAPSSVSGTNMRAWIFVLKAPASGNHTLAASWTGTTAGYLTSASWLNTDTVTGYTSSDNVGGYSSAAGGQSIGVNTTSTGATLVILGNNSGVPAATTGTQIFSTGVGVPNAAASYILGGSGSTHTFNGGAGATGTAWAGIHIIAPAPAYSLAGSPAAFAFTPKTSQGAAFTLAGSPAAIAFTPKTITLTLKQPAYQLLAAPAKFLYFLPEYADQFQLDAAAAAFSFRPQTIAAAASTIALFAQPAAFAFTPKTATPSAYNVLLALPVSFLFVPQANALAQTIPPYVPKPLSVVAPAADTGGTALLADIVAIQTLIGNSIANSVNAAAIPQYQNVLNDLEMQAVDHFMATYWVSADSILAALPPPTNNKFAAFITSALAQIAARKAAVAALVALGTPVSTVGNEAPQYSTAYPPPISGYPLTGPDTFWYQLQVELVDFCMANGVLTAAQILSTLVGAQTYPFNGYASDYTSYQGDIDN